MRYFEEHYDKIRYPIQRDLQAGLRKAQIGAIHAIASHFTIQKEPGIVVMPTGSGKTAVLMMSAFVQRAKRVCVITPSRLVRSQIKENFSTLEILKRIGVLPEEINGPRVKEVVSRITSLGEWTNFYDYDVVVGIPNSISPASEKVPSPPEDLFDLLLIDEAHHSPASTWNELLRALPQAKRILFTATPFRRDKKEIRGKFIYNYLIKEAFKDNIFGEIEYIPVEPVQDMSNDILIAKKAEEVFVSDRKKGLVHFVMVRTDSKKRANELFKKIYEKNTNLKLRLIHSGYSYRFIKRAIRELKEQKLDGIICVNMLGEGFDFPNLKIAAIHAPHKSLEITLQFIGRFARAGDSNIGKAKFIAVPQEIKFETEKLYEEGAIWQEKIENLSSSRIGREQIIRETLDKFEPPEITFDQEDISLYALHPYNHVKVYRVAKDVDIKREIEFPPEFEIVHKQIAPDLSTAIFITRETQKPRWTQLPDFKRSECDLFVVYYHKDSNLIFINASRKNNLIYESIASQYSSQTHKNLPLSKINRVLIGLQDPSFFNIGMKNRILNDNTESYRIIAGSNAQNAISKTDGKLFHTGHVFGKAQEQDQDVTIGFSSGAKIWSNRYSQIPELIDWCKKIAGKIERKQKVVTHSGLDNLTVGEEVFEIPEGIIAAEWYENIYISTDESVVSYSKPDGSLVECGLWDLDLVIDRLNSNKNKIRIIIEGDSLSWAVDFSLNANCYFTLVSNDQKNITFRKGWDVIPLITYLNGEPLYFYFADFSTLQGSNLLRQSSELGSFDIAQIKVIDWSGNNVDIEREFHKSQPSPSDRLSIHDYLKKYLNTDENIVLIYDHGTGELADFIAMNETENEIIVGLYHCKKSGGSQPGDRVNDVYEVCGQVVKSTIWFMPREQLLKKIQSRINNKSSFIKGDMESLENIFEKMRSKKSIYQVILVQPGISKKSLSDKNARNLAASNDYLKNARGENLIVWASE